MDPCEDPRTDCNARFEALEAWQARQNGSLQRIESRIDKMFFALVASGGALIASLTLLVINLAKGCL